MRYAGWEPIGATPTSAVRPTALSEALYAAADLQDGEGQDRRVDSRFAEDKTPANRLPKLAASELHSSNSGVLMTRH